MQFGAPIYRLANGKPAAKVDQKHLRFHFTGKYDGGNPVFTETAAIPTRTLTSVGGIREDRQYSRSKARKHGYAPRTITPMMLVAVANELAARRARNKAAATSRRINRRGAR